MVVARWLRRGQDGTLDFFQASETNQSSDRNQLKFLDSIDSILLGRRTYELFVGFWPTVTTDKKSSPTA